jgi:hypothetical protein
MPAKKIKKKKRKGGPPKFHFIPREKPLVKMNGKLCSFMQKEKKKALEIEEDIENDFVFETVKQFINCIDEEDFNKVHKVTDTVYGFVNKPAVMPDIMVVIEKLTKINKNKIYTLGDVIEKISDFRQKQFVKTGLIDNTILMQNPRPGLSRSMTTTSEIRVQKMSPRKFSRNK